MVVCGQIESVWPTIGSVLALEERVFVVAGRTTESDGGVAVLALDPSTGRAAWGCQIGPGVQRVCDLLALRDGKVAMMNVALDPRDGKSDVLPLRLTGPSKLYLGTQGGLIDGSWTCLALAVPADSRSVMRQPR